MKVTKVVIGVYDIKVNGKVYGINCIPTTGEWKLYDCSWMDCDPRVNWIDTFYTKRDCIEHIKSLEEIK
jgi:hypothetical protein